MRWTMSNCCLVTGLLLAPLGAGCRNDGLPVGNGAGAKKDDLVTVQVVQPVRQTLQRTTTQPATIRAFHRAESYAKVSGYLTDLRVDIGSKVDANAVLAVIDVPEMERSREKQQATIRELQAEEKRYAAAIELAKSGVTAAEALSDQAKADIEKTVAQLTADESQLARVKTLVASKSVGDDLLDESQLKRDASAAAKASAEAAAKSAEANVTVAKQNLVVAESDELAAKEKTKVAQKRLEELDALMAYATLRAPPFNGVVTERNVDLGDLVRNTQAASNGQRKPLFAIASLERVRVQIAVPEDDAPWATVGDAVTLQLRSFPTRSFPGQIDRIAHLLDASTRSMLVEVDLKNPDGVLLPGMYGEATIVLEEKPDALVLPAAAVRYDTKGRSFVYLLDSQDKVSIVDVVTGADDGSQIEITDGLDESARVVGSTIGGLEADQRVKVATAEK